MDTRYFLLVWHLLKKIHLTIAEKLILVVGVLLWMSVEAIEYFSSFDSGNHIEGVGRFFAYVVVIVGFMWVISLACYFLHMVFTLLRWVISPLNKSRDWFSRFFRWLFTSDR